MSDCVYHAWVQHMVHLDIVPSLLSWEMYLLLRRGLGNEKGFTYGGIVPLLIRALSGMYGCQVNVQHRIWTPEMYRVDIRDGKSGLDEDLQYNTFYVMEDMTDDGMFGEEVSKITLAPAVYLLLNQGHAVFNETVPRGGPVMALQVYKE